MRILNLMLFRRKCLDWISCGNGFKMGASIKSCMMRLLKHSLKSSKAVIHLQWECISCSSRYRISKTVHHSILACKCSLQRLKTWILMKLKMMKNFSQINHKWLMDLSLDWALSNCWCSKQLSTFSKSNRFLRTWSRRILLPKIAQNRYLSEVRIMSPQLAKFSRLLSLLSWKVSNRYSLNLKIWRASGTFLSKNQYF